MRASLEGLQPRALISSWFVLVAWLAFRKFCFLIIGLSTPAVLHNHLVLLGFISPAGPAEALCRALSRDRLLPLAPVPFRACAPCLGRCIECLRCAVYGVLLAALYAGAATLRC